MIWANVRNALLVTVVTVLVWAIAESQTLRPLRLNVVVDLQSASERLVVRVAPGETWSALVEAEVEGTAQAISRFRELAAQGVLLEPGDELPAEPGRRVIELREALRRDDRIGAIGATIRRVSPPTVVVEIDEIGSAEVVVVPELPGVELEGPPVVEPAVVTVRAPQSVLNALPESLAARVKPEQLEPLRPGQEAVLTSTPIALPEGRDAWAARVEPPRVSVRLTPRTRTRSAVVPHVPVEVLLSPEALAAWDVQVAPEDRGRDDVRVTGPSEVIERIRRWDIRLVAAVRLTADDLQNGVESKPLELLGLPQGVSAEIEDREVGLQISRRPAPAEPDDDDQPLEQETEVSVPPADAEPQVDPESQAAEPALDAGS